uniref:Reverse transcriptase Ty1/copia-type domain-containing protein n=1 Tax=Trichuris muris TaxID=70415 RepID=A0A5S6Q9M3_TRIMR
MLSDAHLPNLFWGEAVLTAAYLQNRLPCRNTSRTPYEHFYGHKPAVGHRVFGSRVFSLVPSERRKKLSARAAEGVLIGYGNRVKGYRLMDPKTARVWYSRSVRIMEEPAQMTLRRRDRRPTEHSKAAPQVMVNLDEWESHHKEGSVEDAAVKENQVSTPRRSERLAAKDEKRLRPQFSQNYVWKAMDSGPKEPATWDEMLQLPAVERQRWLKAVDAELSSLEKHRVWEMTALPVGKQVISAKWVFKVKRDEQDNVYTYKARLVAHGFTQLQGRDYDETFAPVVRYETVRAFFAVAAVKSMHVRHIDVKTAYLNGELNEELFMELPPGFKQHSTEGKVLPLRRSLYGLKQSARMWNQVASDALKKMGFRSNRADPWFFSRVEKEHGITYVLLYVDDLLVANASSDLTHHVGQQLNGYFEVKNLGEVRQYLGIQVERGEDGSFLLHQSGKICRLI